MHSYEIRRAKLEVNGRRVTLKLGSQLSTPDKVESDKAEKLLNFAEYRHNPAKLATFFTKPRHV